MPDRHRRGIHVRPTSFFTSLTSDPKLSTFRKRQGERRKDNINTKEDPRTCETTTQTLEEA